MIRVLLSLLFMTIVFSCSTTKKGSSYTDVSQISKEDFKPVKQVKYNRSRDKFTHVNSEFTQALNNESLQRVIRYSGDVNLDSDLGKISKYCYEKEFENANDLIKKNNKVYLNNPIFWNQVGTCFLLQRKRRKALLFYNKALALKPNYVPALNNLGVMYVLEKDFSRALVAFKRARKISDFSRTPRFNLANLYLNFGLYNKSIYHAKTLYKNGMKDVDVLNMLATSHLMRSEAKLAISYFQQIESDFLEEARFGVNYAFALFNVGNKEKAKDVLDDVSGKMNKHWKAYYNEVAKLIGVNK